MQEITVNIPMSQYKELKKSLDKLKEYKANNTIFTKMVSIYEGSRYVYYEYCEKKYVQKLHKKIKELQKRSLMQRIFNRK